MKKLLLWIFLTALVMWLGCKYLYPLKTNWADLLFVGAIITLLIIMIKKTKNIR